MLVTMCGCSWLDGDDPSELYEDLCASPNEPLSKVYGGTDLPSLVPLDAGQVLSIGFLGNCTGTLIAARWVLTAKHCEIPLDRDFCLEQVPNICIGISRIVVHPGADVVLIELDDDPRAFYPDITPIPPLAEKLDCSWMGRMAEAAGYGQTPIGTFGSRLFVVEPIVALSAVHVTLDGREVTGLCRGDSGGPIMVIGDDGNTYVAGSLSFGAPSCRGQDSFTRLDHVGPWITDVIDSGPIGGEVAPVAPARPSVL